MLPIATLSGRLKCAALTGFWFGFGYFLAGLYWTAEAFLVEPWRHGWLIPFVLTALPGGMALFFAAAGALAMALWRPGAARVLALAIAFGLAEFARGHVLTGLPWNLLGYALLGNGPMLQLAALFGVYGSEPARRGPIREPRRDLRSRGLGARRRQECGAARGARASRACPGCGLGEPKIGGCERSKHGRPLAHRAGRRGSGQ